MEKSGIVGREIVGIVGGSGNGIGGTQSLDTFAKGFVFGLEVCPALPHPEC